MLQGFPGWPYFTLADHADLMAKLELTSGGRVQIYNVRYRRWEECATTETRQVVPKETLLLRNLGVTDCLLFDQFLNELTGRSGSPLNNVQPLQVTVVTPRSQRTSKRPRPADSELADRGLPVARHAASHTSPLVLESQSSSGPDSRPSRSPFGTPTPASSSSMPSSVSYELFLAPGPSQSPHFTSGLGLTGIPLQPSAMPSLGVQDSLPAPILHGAGDGLEHDWLWQLNRVYVRPGARFPGDIYARDMAQALTWLAQYRGKEIEEHFVKIFPHIRFVSQTYYTQASVWKNCSEKDRDWLRKQPRTPAGMWAACRRKLEEWQGKGSHR